MLLLFSEKFKVETEEPVHIAWSSSEGESDCEESSPPPKPVATPTPSQSRPKPKLNVSSYLQLLNNEAGRHCWSCLLIVFPPKEYVVRWA